MSELPVKRVGRIRRLLRALPWVAKGAYTVARKLPKEQRQELIAVARDPDEWGDAVGKAWDVTKVEAVEAKDAFGTLGKIVLGRKTSKDERKQAADQLGVVGMVVPPLRVFMIPGSQILLGIVAFVIPWRLVPDKWIPFKSLKEDPESAVETQKKKRFKLFRRNRQKVIDTLDD